MPDSTELEQMLGYCFCERSLFNQALTHPSHEHEQAGTGDYQRLEFLGDAVLGMVLAEALYLRFSTQDEGVLSRIRSQVVNQESLAGIARSIGLGSFIRLGRGEEQNSGRDKDSILADVLEALIAAVYLDGGLERARLVILNLFDQVVDLRGGSLNSNDSKSELQELLSARRMPTPHYHLVEESGPPHDRLFRFRVLVDGAVVGEGEGRSKKNAQQAAAAQALKNYMSPCDSLA
ncbi:MAG: ribonuclease III [Desulfuromonadales bacterium]|nr:ribonuclease III [Desulfuromonadales bacterium]